MRKYIGKNEFKILNILWEKSPLLVSEIVEMDKSLKIPTVQRLINLQHYKIAPFSTGTLSNIIPKSAIPDSI